MIKINAGGFTSFKTFFIDLKCMLVYKLTSSFSNNLDFIIYGLNREDHIPHGSNEFFLY